MSEGSRPKLVQRPSQASIAHVIIHLSLQSSWWVCLKVRDKNSMGGEFTPVGGYIAGLNKPGSGSPFGLFVALATKPMRITTSHFAYTLIKYMSRPTGAILPTRWPWSSWREAETLQNREIPDTPGCLTSGQDFSTTTRSRGGLPTALASRSKALSIATRVGDARFVVHKIEPVKDRPCGCPPL